MKRIIIPVSMALCLFFAAGDAALADPGDVSLSDFTNIASLFEGSRSLNPRPIEGFAPVLQDDDWGWGEEEKPSEDPPASPGGGEEEGGGEEGGDGWGWGEDEGGGEEGGETPPESPGGGSEEGGGEWGDWGDEGGMDEGGGEEPTPGPSRREDPSGPSVSYAKKTRIGFDFGGFLPFGSKEEDYEAGGVGGFFIGFGLPPFLGSLTVTTELHVGGAITGSSGQTNGYDVTTNLILGKLDLLFHFMPNSRKFNLNYFLGLAVGYEMSSAKDVATGVTTTESYPGFLIDTGLAAWINLGGNWDLILKLEFNFIPMSENVSFFATGQMGFQVKF
ncbi:MAG: hypothetical protein ACYTFG_06120 [Planctomycetota bacterium]|jgi:hypothetical protein